MEGLTPFLRRAREQHLIDAPKRIPPPPPQPENEENEEPDSVNKLLETLSLHDGHNKVLNVKPAQSLQSSEFAVPLPPNRSASQPRGFAVPPAPPHRSRSVGPQVLNVQDSVDNRSSVKSVRTIELDPKMPALQSVQPSSLSLTACEFCENAFEGLPGMEAYRDTVSSDSDDEKHNQSAADGDEDESSGDEDEDTLLSLTNLITTTQKLRLGERKSTSCQSNNSRPSESDLIRKTRCEVKERFIGRKKGGVVIENDKRPIVDITRQSFTEFEESDVGRASEVVLGNFPLLPESGKEASCEETEVFSPIHTTRAQEEENSQKQQVTVFYSPTSAQFTSSEDELTSVKKAPRAPPNTPLAQHAQTPPPPVFRRSSVAYTPEQPDFRRSSVAYSPCDDNLAPTTPPKTLELHKAKPPKTEAPHRTKSRIELPSPLVGVCRSAPSAQSGVHPGSLSVPAKSRAPSRTPTRRLIAVADTNVLLTNLELVENTQNYPNVTLVIPYIVVRELDGLKSGSSRKAHAARAALHSLRSLIKSSQNRTTIHFQNIDEVPRHSSYRGRARSNDDRVLDCCLYYSEKADDEEGQKVILLTNDVALQVKAESVGSQAKGLPSLGMRLVTAMGMRTFYEKEVWHLA